MENDLESDTIHMKGLTIHGEYFEKFSPGSTIKKSDSLDKAAFQPSNLNDIIGYKNPIYFKSYGNGMLSSIAFRGTGASHTAVLWNGINVNQPTIGQSDFSLFPVLAFNNVGLFTDLRVQNLAQMLLGVAFYWNQLLTGITP